MDATAASERSRAEAERQLSAAAERHREILASMQQLGRPEAGQHVAAKALGRAVALVSFALSARRTSAFLRAARRADWVGAGPGAGGARAGGAPAVVRGSVGAPGVDARAVAEAAVFDALARLQDLTERVLADLDREAGASASAAPAELDDLNNRWEIAWRAWREELTSRAR